MNHIKGELHIVHCNLAEAVVSNDELTIRIYPREVMTLDELEANAHLITASPLMHGQLETGIKALSKALAHLNFVEINEARGYIRGVIAGNEIALAKAKGRVK